MAPPLLTLRDIELTFGGTPLLEAASFSVSAGERLCLVGRNGSGKSTLLKIAAGLIDVDAGERFVQPGTSIRYLPQEPDLTAYATTLEYVEAGMDASSDPYRPQYLLDQLTLSGTEDPKTLSGGEARRAALARVLAPEPDILLLDEPTNHLDLTAIEWLEKELKSIRSTIVLISHDRRFLENLTRTTVWIYQGETRRLDKGFAGFEAWRDGILENQVVERHKLDRKIVREMDWMRKGVTGRRKRNQGRLRALKDLREQRTEQRALSGAVQMAASESRTSGKIVIEATDVEKSYGGPKIINNLNLRILRGDRLAIVGPNGAGKTTLLNLLTGALAPDTGTVKLGTNLEMVTLDQQRESLNDTWTLADALTGGHGDSVIVGGQQKHVIGYMKDFLFPPEQAGTPIGRLSGGERGRLMLARALAQTSNLLVLDEPTNDLDLETLDLLQEMLADYAGTVLLVSHDRDFIDRVAVSTLRFEGDGLWTEYAGGYSDMVSQRRAGAGVRPKPLKSERAKPEYSANPAKKSNSNNSSASGQSGGGEDSERKPQLNKLNKSKMSYKDKYALETLPVQMDALQAEIAKLQTRLADPEYYARDPDQYHATAAKLEKAEDEMASAEEQWLSLELLKEELEEQ
jgi:ABC transport system ATP-binding/permease protein